MSRVSKYMEKKPAGYDELEIIPLPGAKMEDILKCALATIKKTFYPIIIIAGGVNNLTRHTGKQIIINETFVLQMPLIMISQCQNFIQDVEDISPKIKIVFCPFLPVSLDKYNSHLKGEAFCNFCNGPDQVKINKAASKFNRYIKNLNDRAGILTPTFTDSYDLQFK